MIQCVLFPHRRRHRKGTGLILTTEMRSSTLLNNIIRVEPKSVSRSPEPLQSNGAATIIAAGLEVEGRREGACGERNGGMKEDTTTDSDDDISKDSNNGNL